MARQIVTGGRFKGGVSVKIQGMQETIKRLVAFDKKFRRATLRKAANEASKIVLQVMKSNVPQRKKEYGVRGATKKSLGRKVKVFKGGTAMWYGVGPRTKWKREVNHPVKFFQRAGRIHRINLKDRPNADPLAGFENQQPSRKMHLVERKHGVIARTHHQTMARTQQIVKDTIEQAVASA